MIVTGAWRAYETVTVLRGIGLAVGN